MSDEATKPTEKKEAAASPAANTKKDSTIELPMFDLTEALNFVSKIHEAALETVAMPKVAEGMGYTHPSSTPFYRRMVAARLFGLISKTGAELSARARTYLKPNAEDAAPNALRDAVNGVGPYGDEILRYSGKKMNLQFVANSFATKFNLTDGCAQTCAKVFESSLKSAGLIGPDGLIGMQAAISKSAQPPADLVDQAPKQDSANANFRTHVLPLSNQRTISVTAPLDINAKEVGRIKKWLEVVLLIEAEDAEDLPS